MGSEYRRANDAGAWVKNLWSVNPDSVTLLSERWALEIVGAPLAWGCAVGSDSTTVAIVDEGIQGPADLLANIGPEWRRDLNRYNAKSHGTWVASIAGAQGNNGEGISGMMWNADLRPYDARVDAAGNVNHGRLTSDAIAADVKLAIDDGASVVNLSLGPAWKRTPGSVPDSFASDDSLANLARIRMREVFLRFNTNDLPLLVVAAGNDAVDARWNGFPLVTNDFPEQVLVVGSSTFDGSLADSSNNGNLVQIAAPGEGVYTLSAVGAPVSVNGTSFAAAYVTGLAGLLKSFDPGLTAADLKDFILQGAARGGRTASGIPLLDAYESLRAAAERSGAPLCGNDVWAANGQLHARRTESLIEPLTTVGSPIGQVEVLHGGKFIRYTTPPNTAHVLRWPTWQPASMPADTAAPRGGTRASVYGYSHEQDSVAFIDGSIVSGTSWFVTGDTEQAPVMVQEGAGLRQQMGQITVNDFPEPVKETCLERNSSGFCFFSVTENRTWLFRLGYPQYPQGGRQAYVTVSPMRHVEIDSTPWAPCPFDSSHECRAVLSLQDQTEALIYRKDLATGAAPVLVDTIADESVFWIGHSETGEGIVLGRGRRQITFWADAEHYYQTGDPFYDFSQEVDSCSIEYRRETDFGSENSILTMMPVSSASLITRAAAPGAGQSRPT